MTQNNNASMATVVETFFVEETTNLIHDGDALQRWNDRIAELGLEGQNTIVVKEKSPIPFLWMNDALIATFEVLCPSKAKIEEFDKMPIPVELLDTVALCKKEQYFDLIEVWFNEKEKDPAIVGYKYAAKDSDWMSKYYAKKYLIGRWADVKASLDTLIDRAKKMFVSIETLRLKQEIKERQRRLEDLEEHAQSRFANSLPEIIGLPF